MQRKTNGNNKNRKLMEDGLLDEHLNDIANEMSNLVTPHFEEPDDNLDCKRDEKIAEPDAYYPYDDSDEQTNEDDFEESNDAIPCEDDSIDYELEAIKIEELKESARKRAENIDKCLAESEQEENLTRMHFDYQLNKKILHDSDRYRAAAQDQVKLASKQHRLDKPNTDLTKKNYLMFNFFKRKENKNYNQHRRREEIAQESRISDFKLK